MAHPQHPYGQQPGYGPPEYGPGGYPPQPFLSPYPIADTGARAVRG